MIRLEPFPQDSLIHTSLPRTSLIGDTSLIRTVDELDDRLSEPTEATVRAMAALKGDLVILGIGGKMGPTLARMAKRASDLAGVERRIIGVSRFSASSGSSASSALEQRLNSWGIETHRADLLDPTQHSQLPAAPNVLFMAGMKFGATGQESLTWAMNTFLPGLVCQRYRKSRIVVFSTGNVYGLSPVSRAGSIETDPLQPLGEYAQSCLGRERIFEHFSRTQGTEIAILRLNYASELRYGVLLDIAQRVQADDVISLEMGHLNAIWQGDAAAIALQSLLHTSSPPFVLNIAGPELLSVARVAAHFGELLQKPVRYGGVESPDALLSNAQKSIQLFGYPQVNIGQLMRWIAQWVAKGGETLNKPTHFENRAGDF